MHQLFWITHGDHFDLEHFDGGTLQATQLGQPVPQAAEGEVLEHGPDELLLEPGEGEVFEIDIDRHIAHQRHQLAVERDLIHRRHHVVS